MSRNLRHTHNTKSHLKSFRFVVFFFLHKYLIWNYKKNMKCQVTVLLWVSTIKPAVCHQHRVGQGLIFDVRSVLLHGVVFYTRITLQVKRKGWKDKSGDKMITVDERVCFIYCDETRAKKICSSLVTQLVSLPV